MAPRPPNIKTSFVQQGIKIAVNGLYCALYVVAFVWFHC